MSRTILIHLNVEADDNDPRSADEITRVVLGALEVGLEGAPGWMTLDGGLDGEGVTADRLVVTAPLCEEV